MVSKRRTKSICRRKLSKDLSLILRSSESTQERQRMSGATSATFRTTSMETALARRTKIKTKMTKTKTKTSIKLKTTTVTMTSKEMRRM